MRPPKWLISGVLSIFGFGILHDAAAGAGFIKGDGQDHTAPRVPVSLATAGSDIATSTSTIIATVHVGNTVTGTEYWIPPRDRPRVRRLLNASRQLDLHRRPDSSWPISYQYA
jgi:hypothetical protein